MEFLRSPGGLDVGTSLSPTSSRSTIKPKLHRSHTALPSITTRATATRRTTHNGALDEEGTGAAGRQQEKHKSSGGSRRPHLHVRSSHSHSYKPQQHHHHRHLQKEPPLSQEQQNSSSSSRHHHNSHSHRHHGSSARDAIQSAIQLQPPTSFGDLLRTGTRSTGPSAPGSRQESRRQSLAVGMSDGLGSGNGDWRVGAGAGSGSSSGGGMLVVATKEGLERQKEKARLRQEDIRTTLSSLLQNSLRSTRRLDDTYYSILSHVSSLRTTITNLQDLSSLTRTLHDTFQTDTSALSESINSQTTAFTSTFEAQTQRIEALEERIKRSKERAEKLDDRLEEANRRVQQWEEWDKEEGERSKRRVTIIWTVIGIVTAILVPLLFISSFKQDTEPTVRPWKMVLQHPEQQQQQPLGGLAASIIDSIPRKLPDAAALDKRLDTASMPSEVKSILSSVRAAPFAAEPASSKGDRTTSVDASDTSSSAPASVDPLVQIFDEL